MKEIPNSTFDSVKIPLIQNGSSSLDVCVFDKSLSMMISFMTGIRYDKERLLFLLLLQSKISYLHIWK